MYITYGKTDKLVAMYSEGKNKVVSDTLKQVKITPSSKEVKDIKEDTFQIYYTDKKLKFKNKVIK